MKSQGAQRNRFSGYTGKIFRRYLFSQAAVWVFLGGSLSLAARFVQDRTLVERVAFWTLASLLFLGASAVVGLRFLSPLRRLLEKTQKVLDGDVLYGDRGAVFQNVEIPANELPGASHASRDLAKALEYDEEEWSELEGAIDRVRRSLQAETEALRREREELTTLMSAIGEAILAIDTQGKVLFFNSRFALLFGDRELSRAGRSLTEIFRAPELLEGYRHAISQGEVSVVSLQMGTHMSGEQRRHFQVSLNPLKRASAEGEIYGAVGIFHDVTELKRAEQIRIDFVANVSHELRTPLTSIKGFADTLEEDVRQGRMDEVSNYLGRITKNADRLMALIQDLLDLSSLESGNEVRSEWVSTEEITQRVFERLDSLREKKQHQLSVEAASPQVFADYARLEQVLSNLVENAMKYTPSPGKVSVRWVLEGNGDVILSVSDSGPGIAPEHQARLFERFYRVDKGRSREMGGTGLGLAIVKHILQAHGGSVSVMSEVGRGTEFRCRFPKAP